MTKISILGTGWLGLPLAKALITSGNIIKGSTTSENRLDILEKNNIDPYHITLTENGPNGDIHSFLNHSELLIINVPPGLRRDPTINFVAKIQHLIPYIEKSTIKNVIFVSSTSVFAEQEGFPLISNKTLPNATSNAGKQLIEIERLLQQNKNFRTTLLRFAGLFGPNRHPAQMLSRRTNIKNPNAPVNLIHLEDCIGIIKKIIETSTWGQTLNASHPDHPIKVDYYSEVCEQMGLPIPDYNFETPSKGKTVDSKNIMKVLDYKFRFKL